MSESKAWAEVFGLSCVIFFFAALVARAYILYLEITAILTPPSF